MNYPERIHVSGMPIPLRGWNGWYHKENNNEYHLKQHNYYGIWIVHTYFKLENGKWILKAGDFGSRISCNERLLGDWETFLVTDKTSLRTWFKSNYGIMFLLLLVCGSIRVMLKF